MPRNSKLKLLLAKLEATYGVDPNPTGAADAICVLDSNLDPMLGNDVELAHETPYLSANPTVPGALHRKMTFKAALAGSGTPGTPPSFAPFLRACGMAETIVAGTSVTYNKVSAGHDSLTMYWHRDGTLYTAPGARGTCSLVYGAGNVPMLEFEFLGLFTAPSDVAIPVPTYTPDQSPLSVTPQNTPVFTIGGTAVPLRNLTLALGNTLEVNQVINHEEVEIVDVGETITGQVPAGNLAEFDPFTLGATAERRALVLSHGTAAGNIATLSVPSAQFQRVGALTEAQGKDEWPLSLLPQPVTGNDQFTLTFT